MAFFLFQARKINIKMIYTPHVISGAVIGSLIQNLPAAFAIGFVSHFVFDAIPHLETSTYRKEKDKDKKPEKKAIIFEVFEVLVGTIIVYFFWKNHEFAPAIFWAAFGSILPDLIDNVPFWSWELRKLPGFKQFHEFHEFVHYNLKKKYWYFGIPVYIIVLIALIIFW